MSNPLEWHPLLLIFVIAAAAAVVTLLAFGRNALTRDKSRTTTEVRKSYEALFGDLWSEEIHRRLGALFVAQKIAKSGDADSLAQVLIAFIRYRLSGDRENGAGGFEDVRLALIALGTAAVRVGTRRRRQFDLSGANFRGAALLGIDLHKFRLMRCNFDGCRLPGANFAGCDLAGASFAGADLRGASFQNADISSADMSNSDLTRARLSGAKTGSTNFGGSILVGAIGLEQEQLDAAFGDAATALPEELRIAAMRSRRPLKLEMPA